jgi:hypothetical protein
MKRYGANKATEFTRKQINVIFAKAKAGEIKIEKWVIADFYNMADYYGFDDNGNAEESERDILEIIEAVFASDIEKAQELIDNYTTKWFERMGRKAQAKANRSLVA